MRTEKSDFNLTEGEVLTIHMDGSGKNAAKTRWLPAVRLCCWCDVGGFRSGFFPPHHVWRYREKSDDNRLKHELIHHELRVIEGNEHGRRAKNGSTISHENVTDGRIVGNMNQAS